MARLIKFKHLTNTYKPIVGVPHTSCSPEVMTRSVDRTGDDNKNVTVDESYFDPETTPIVTVLLQSELPRELSADEKKLPKARQKFIEARNNDDYEKRLAINEAIRFDIKRYAEFGVIKIIEEVEADTQAPSNTIEAKPSEVNARDFVIRGISIPKAVREQQV